MESAVSRAHLRPNHLQQRHRHPSSTSIRVQSHILRLSVGTPLPFRDSYYAALSRCARRVCIQSAFHGSTIPSAVSAHTPSTILIALTGHIPASYITDTAFELPAFALRLIAPRHRRETQPFETGTETCCLKETNCSHHQRHWDKVPSRICQAAVLEVDSTSQTRCLGPSRSIPDDAGVNNGVRIFPPSPFRRQCCAPAFTYSS
jgi:hypothetical protein